ncbi:MAG: IS1634 family transposase [Rickettsia endosymbiont of Culicoides impunctatus]|nr:MAG: IS1634 family transposase [Rickettsia endosymbiont of Culicoides impunctatus]
MSSTNIIRNVVLARIANPTSKRETVNLLVNNYEVALKLDSVYKTMDKIDDKVVEKIEQCALLSTQKLFKEKIDVLFYDATTLYFESFTEDELKSKGFSKDHKFNEVQVMLSIFVTNNGIPIGYEIFLGATYEGHTLLKALDSLKDRFAIDKVVFVADSGMLNNENLALLEQVGYQYIVGAKIKNMTKDITAKILNSADYQPLTIDAEEYKGKIIELYSINLKSCRNG